MPGFFPDFPDLPPVVSAYNRARSAWDNVLFTGTFARDDWMGQRVYADYLRADHALAAVLGARDGEPWRLGTLVYTLTLRGVQVEKSGGDGGTG